MSLELTQEQKNVYENDDNKINSSFAYLPSCNYAEFRFTVKNYVVYLDGNPMFENVEDVTMSKAPINVLMVMDECNENKKTFELTQEQKDLLVELKEKYARELEFTTPENPSELGMVLAYQFYKQFESQCALVYPPRYTKGKFGAFPLSVCYLPDGHDTNYAYYEGVYVNFNFAQKGPYQMSLSFFMDGAENDYFDFLTVRDKLNDGEKVSSVKRFLFEKMECDAELFERFAELEKMYC